MKSIALTTAVVMLLSLASFAVAAEQKPTPALKNYSEKISYVLGLEIGTGLKESPAKIDLDLFMRGIRDTLQGRKPLIDPAEADTVKQKFSKQVRADQVKKRAALGEKNRAAEKAFMADNKSKQGVVTTASGLQYIVLRPGDGPKPQKTDRVKVNYRGRLLDGTEFDSSYKRGQPATFPVDGVIAGWTEAIQLMNVGGKYRLFIPAKLAYGQRGAGRVIGPNAMLIFDVELLGIEKKGG